MLEGDIYTHTNGNEYEVVAEAKGKLYDNWVPGVVYKSKGGMVFWTGLIRWNRRFSAKKLAGSENVSDIWDSEDTSP